MIELVWDEAFVRAVKKWQKRHPELIGRFKERLLLFSEQPSHPSLKTHSLSGNLKGCSSFSINYDNRSHALRGNAAWDALRPVSLERYGRHSHAERGNDTIPKKF